MQTVGSHNQPIAASNNNNNNNPRNNAVSVGNKKMTEQDKVTAEWDGWAGEWDDMAGGYRDAFVDLLWEETGYTTPEQRKDLVVVDFGCGTGLLTEVLQGQVRRVVSLDVAPSMVDMLKDKIKSGHWGNVDAYCAVAANLDATPDAKAALDALKGKVDIVAASSVLSFVPESDLEATMQVLASLLKPGTGILCHSDWPQTEENPDGFSEKKAMAMYKMGGLQAKTTKMINMKMGRDESPVFVGKATKSS